MILITNSAYNINNGSTSYYYILFLLADNKQTNPMYPQCILLVPEVSLRLPVVLVAGTEWKCLCQAVRVMQAVF